MTVILAPVHEPIGELLTATDYDALPANPRRELVDGVVRMMATPTPFHQDVVHTFRLGDGTEYVPTGVFRPGDVIVAPGLDWVSIAVDDLLGED
jgi:hypothetical protein